MDEETKQNEPVGTPPSVPAAVPAPADFHAILGEKMGMTQLFDEQGLVVPCTVVRAGPCQVTRILTQDKDGYQAVQVGFRDVAEKKLSKPVLGQFKKAGLKPMKHLREFRVPTVDGFTVGQVVTASVFKPGDYVDVQGVSKGKGFAGGMKRHNFRGGPASHGASDRERAPGSLASRRSLGRVLPGQRMAGHMGVERVTIQKIEVAKVEPETNLLYLRGAVPGASKSFVVITETVKLEKHRVVRDTKAGKGKKDKSFAAKMAKAETKTAVKK